MRIITYTILLALCILTATPAMGQKKSVLGSWEYESSSEEDAVPRSLLSLDIQRDKQGNRVVGAYCYISSYGRRIDCPDNNEKNVEGTISPDETSARLRIRSYSESRESVVVVDVATEGEQLRYTLLDTEGSSFSGPKNVTLSRPGAEEGCAVSVTSDKAFFHMKPDASTRDGAYVVRRDMVIASRVSGDRAFIYASYVNDRGHETHGWLKCDELGLCLDRRASELSRCAHLRPLSKQPY